MKLWKKIVNQHYFSIIKKVNDILEEVKVKKKSKEKTEGANVSSDHGKQES